jgi:predicted nucleic acid-binding protein
VNRFKGQILGIDSSPLIYFIEDHPRYAPALIELFEGADRGALSLVTSTVAIAEVLVHPLRSGRAELVRAYRDILLGSTGMTAVPVSAEIAELAATIRADHHSRTPGALQLATAVYSGAAAFVTNDRGIPRLSNLELVLLSDL